MRELVARLYDRQATRAYRMALLVSGDPAVAADVVFDAFVGLTRSPGLDELQPADESACVLGAVHDALERSLAMATRPEPEPDGALLGESLSRRERQVLAYCWHAGAPIADVAQLVGEDDASVRAMLARSLRGIALDLEADSGANALGALHRKHGSGAETSRPR